MSTTNPESAPSLFSDGTSLVLPSFGGLPGTSLAVAATKEAERRLIEAKTVNPVTYIDLEHCFQEAYRELRKNLATIGYQLLMADKKLEMIKSDILLDKYPEFMKDKPKNQDNADLRKAFMMRDPEYLAVLDRVAMLKAIEDNMDGKIKVMENASRYCKKRMDLIIRSGLSSSDLYVTSGKK